jgi:fibronectin-binding autotransporter adhesin
VDNATLAFKRTNTLTQGTDFASTISGLGGVAQVGSGITVLNGTNTYTGPTVVSAGTLLVNSPGSLASASAVTVAGGTLGGTGTIYGPVTVQAGAPLAPGTSAGTLNIDNSLALSDSSILNFDLGAASDLVDLVTDLSLGATKTLNVTQGAGFDTGITYHLIHYTGTDPGNASSGWTVSGAGAYSSAFSLSGSAGSRYLDVVFTGGGNYWAPDASGGQGSATDHLTSTAAKWATSAGIQGTLGQSSSGALVFGDTAGTVTVDGTVTANAGLTLKTDGYVLAAGSSTPNINLAGASAAINTITTDPGVTATLSVPLTGTHGLTKAGTGTLGLSAASNNYGATIVKSGTLEIGSAGALPSGFALTIDTEATAAAGQAAAVPEPGSVALLAAGAVALVVAAWRRRK